MFILCVNVKKLSKKRLTRNGLVGSSSIELDKRDTDYIMCVKRENQVTNVSGITYLLLLHLHVNHLGFGIGTMHQLE